MTFRSFASPVLSLSGILAAVVAPAAGQLSPLAGPVLVGEAVEVLARREPASPATATTLVLETAPIRPAAALPALASETGGFFVADSGGRSFTDTFALRGLVNTPLFGEPALTVYLDGIPLGSTFTFPTELTGFALAELHRGPSAGTTFGRAGPGGVLALLTPAGHRSAGGDAQIRFGSHGTRIAEVTGRSATGGAVDVFVAAGYRARDGFITNSTLQEDVDHRDGRSALARLRIRPSDTAELTLLATGWRARDGAQPLVPLGGPLFTVERSSEGVTHADARHAGLTGAFMTPVGRLSATTAYTDWELGPYWNTLNFGFAELENGSTLRQRMWSEEITLAADPQAARPWRVGLFGADTTTDGAFIRAFSGFTFEESSYRIDSRNLAAFGETTWPLTAAVEMSAGLRVEETRRELDRREQIPTSSVIRAHHRSSALLPHLALNYAWDPATTFFARVGAGYKPGGFSAFTGNPELTTFAAERTRSLETGVTHAPTGGNVHATLRLYGYTIEGYQIERSFATGAEADDYLVVNAPRARSVGGELELAWRPVDGWRIALDLGLTHITLRDFRDPYSGNVFDGKQAPYMPAYDAGLRVDYQHATGWFGGVDVTSNGRTYYTEDENRLFSQSAYTLVGGRLGWGGQRLRVSVSGANLTDERYYSSITPGPFHGTPGAPRTWVMEAALRF